MRRAVVTGGAGFIGSYVAEILLAAGCEVLIVDDLSTGSEANVPGGARFELLDITHADPLARVLNSFSPDVICHLAAQSSVTISVKDPARDLDVNVRGTFNVCECARASRAAVVFASTGGALYGDGAPTPTREDFTPEPLAPYGASKLAGESYVMAWARLHGQKNVVLRLGNVYGPRQSPHGEAGVVAIFSDRLRQDLRPTVYGDGTQTRDYVHASDVARAFYAASTGGRQGTFNVGWGKEHTVLEVLEELQSAAATTLEPEFKPLRFGELHRSALDPSAIRTELGWEPIVDFKDGLRQTFRSYKASNAPPAMS